ncbi:MAG: ABC transporter permease, partial [Bradymonadia bacterium]
LLITLYVVSDFGAVAVLDCDVLTWVLYTERNSRVVFEIGLLLLVAVLPLVAGIRWLRADEVSEYALDFNQITRRSLNVPSAIGSYLLYTMMAGVGAVFPAAVLIQWIVEGYTQSIEFISLLEPWVTTALYAVLASLLTVSIAIWVCWRIYRGAANRALLDTLVYLPSSLPGVLIGVGLLQLVLGIKRSSSAAADVFGYFEMTGGILLVAYSMRFLAQAYAALRPGFNRLDPQVDEAARSLGASELTIWRAIRIPGLAPSLAVALALTFLSVCKELPITLSLIPLEQKTLAYVIFDAQGEGALPDVGLASFCLLTMILVMQACTQYWRRIYG